MRFGGYARSQRALAPVLATLAVLAIVHGGGPASPEDAYGFSALALFGVLGWQAKLSVDTEPDAQRQLSYLAVGSARRDVVSGVLAAGATAIPTVLVAVAAPWVAGAIETPESSGALAGAVLFGLWLHLLAAIAAVAVGVCASRPVTRARGWGVAVLVGASVLVLVLGLAEAGPVQWLVPQLIGGMRAARDGDLTAGIVITLHALIWSTIVFGGYVILRSRRR
jgi:hypothetical protein